MGKILSKTASGKITVLNKKFQKFADKGWMCEGGEYNGVPCNHLFNNDTEEFIRADYNGNILIAVTIRTSLTLPIPKGRGFLVASEGYRLTSSFLIGRTPS